MQMLAVKFNEYEYALFLPTGTENVCRRSDIQPHPSKKYNYLTLR